MATVTGLTAARMLAIEAATIVSGVINGTGHIILTKHDGSQVDAGSVPASVPAATTSSQGLVALADNATTITGTDATTAVTPAGLASKLATTTALGLVELADNTTTIAGVDGTRVVTPAGLASVVASTSQKGLVALADNTTTNTGTDAAKAVTPAGLASVLTGKQAQSSTLTAFAALTPTDNDVLQRKAGAWTNRTVAQLASDLSASGTTPLSWVNVKDYGVTGNGSTDDTTALQSALTAIPANGGVLYIPPNFTCKISSPLVASVSGTEIVGGGWSSRILFDGSVSASAISATGNIRLFVRDIRVSQTNASHIGTAIDLSQTNGSVVERVLIDAGGSGVAPLVGVLMNASTCHYNTVRNSRINYGGASSAGIKLIGGSHSNTVQDVRLVPQGDDSASSGVYIASTHSTTLIHPDVENGSGNGIWLDTGADSTTILNAYCELNNIGLKIASGVMALMVLGGTFQTSTVSNIQDNGASSPIILNAWPNNGSGSYNRVALTNADKFTINGVPVPASTFQASDHGAIAWSYDPANATNSSLTVSGVMYMAEVNVRFPTTISKASVGIGTAASGVVANQNFIGLIDSTGTLVASTAAGAIDSSLTAAGVLTGTFATPYVSSGGKYWVVFINNATTPAQIARSGGFSSVSNYNLASSLYRYCTNGSGLTALPSTITIGNNTLTNMMTMWAAVL